MAVITGAAILAKLGANKWIIIAALVAGVAGVGYWKFDNWRDNLIEVSEKAGFEEAERQYVAAVDVANAKVDEKNKRLDAMELAFDLIAQREQQNITVKFDPIIKDLRNEIANDPIYRQCVISDGVRNSINLGRSSVNSAIDSTTPRSSGQGPSETVGVADGGDG